MQKSLHFFSKRSRYLHPYCQELLLLNEDAYNDKAIQLKELRVGNLLNLDSAVIELTTISASPNAKIGFKVIGLSLEEMTFELKALNKLSPISLNQKILSCCQLSPHFRYERNCSYRHGGVSTVYLPQVKVYYKEVLITEVCYLHQLQNVHFFLTADEMKVTIQD